MNEKVPNLIGKSALDVINYLLIKNQIVGFYYRAYIKKTEDAFDESIQAKDLNNLESILLTEKSKDPRYLVSFQSQVQTKQGTRHLPMIDFSNHVINNLNVADVEKVLRDLGEKEGFILDSGRCFHYYGTRLLTDDKWKDFMLECSKHPEIGERYISHQLRRGLASLRITTDGSKPKMPVVIKEFRG